MTKAKSPRAMWLTEDYPVVILHAHVSPEEAMKISEHDIGDIEQEYGKITSVNHYWAQYRKAGEDDLPSCVDGIEEGDTVLCIRHTGKRPRGVCTKVTVPVFDGWE